MVQSESAWTLCWLVPLLLGGAVVPWLLWIIVRPRLRCPKGKLAQGAVSSSLRILWLTPACREALGECGKLARLSRMSEQDVGRLLFSSPLRDGEEYPTRDQYKTWPRQAELICAGSFDELQRYQAELIGDAAPEAVPEVSSLFACEDGSLKLNFDRITIAVSGSMLLLAVVGHALIHSRGGCLCASGDCGVSPDKTVLLKVQSEQLFAYNDSKVSLPSVRQVVLDDWAETLRAHKSVKVISIRAMTDPIGGAEYNAALAAQRGAAVRTLLEELADFNVKQPLKYPTRIDRSTIPTPTGTGADPQQLNIWSACKVAFNDQLPQKVQPLEACAGKLTEEGCVDEPSGERQRSVFGEFELSSYSYNVRRKDAVSRSVIELMRNERKLIECLAPMRRVLVELQDVTADQGQDIPKNASDGSSR